MNSMIMQIIRLAVTAVLLTVENLDLFHSAYKLPGIDPAGNPTAVTHTASASMMQNLYASFGVLSLIIPLVQVLAAVLAIINMTPLSGKKTILVGNILCLVGVVLAAAGMIHAGTVCRRY